jgi:hypothetical protein
VAEIDKSLENMIWRIVVAVAGPPFAGTAQQVFDHLLTQFLPRGGRSNHPHRFEPTRYSAFCSKRFAWIWHASPPPFAATGTKAILTLVILKPRSFNLQRGL